jgi:hypothetical protein
MMRKLSNGLETKKIIFMMFKILKKVVMEIFNILVLGALIINHGKFKKKYQLNLLNMKIY